MKVVHARQDSQLPIRRDHTRDGSQGTRQRVIESGGQISRGVERETFESALNMGRRALVKLGLGERRASRAATLFREQDDKFFKQLAPIAGEEEAYTMAVRDARDTTERLLRAEMQKIADEEDETEAAVAERKRRLEANKERV